MPPCRSLPRLLAPLLLAVTVAVAWAQGGSDAPTPAALEARLQWAERQVAANPGDAQARFLVGVVLMDLQRDGEAMARFQALAQEFPELPDPQNNIALLHARAGRLEAARVALETALRNDPTHRLARQNLGHVHLMLAVQAWEQAAATGPLEPALQRTLEGARALLASRPLAAR